MEENSTSTESVSIVWNLENASQANLSDNTNTTTEPTSSSDTGRLIRLATLPVNIIFGTIGNVLILFVMQRGSLKRTPICLYMSVLAVADTGKGTFVCNRISITPLQMLQRLTVSCKKPFFLFQLESKNFMIGFFEFITMFLLHRMTNLRLISKTFWSLMWEFMCMSC